MDYKLQVAIKKNRTKFVVCAILWLVLTIVFVAPLAYTMFQANAGEMFSLGIFIEKLPENIMNPMQTFSGIFANGVAKNFFSLLIAFSICYIVIFFIGFSKSTPKHEFSNIEHGSSDWSQKGEQYEVLSKNKGIVLAEDNYLPLDKRGNVNVLVVGRFWFW